MLEASLETLVGSLAVLLLVWVLKRLRVSGNGSGLVSLFKSVSRLSKDFGMLVETIDGLFQDLSLLGQENEKLRRSLEDERRLSSRMFDANSRDEREDLNQETSQNFEEEED